MYFKAPLAEDTADLRPPEIIWFTRELMVVKLTSLPSNQLDVGMIQNSLQTLARLKARVQFYLGAFTDGACTSKEHERNQVLTHSM